MAEKVVTITDTELIDLQEIYTLVYNCPNCSTDDEPGLILGSFKYCPMCGVKIEFNTKEY